MKRTIEGELLTGLVLDIFKLSGLLITEGDKLTEEFSLTSARWKVLGAVTASPVSITVADIAREMGLTRQAVQRLMNEMNSDGLVDFRENPKHKRAQLIVLTDKGLKTYELLDKKQSKWINSIASEFKQGDLELVDSNIKKLIQVLGSK